MLDFGGVAILKEVTGWTFIQPRFLVQKGDKKGLESGNLIGGYDNITTGYHRQFRF